MSPCLVTIDADLTAAQKRVLLEVAFHQPLHSITVGYLSAVMGKSKNAIHQHLVALRRKGWLAWDDGRCGTVHVSRPIMFKLVDGKAKGSKTYKER